MNEDNRWTCKCGAEWEGRPVCPECGTGEVLLVRQGEAESLAEWEAVLGVGGGKLVVSWRARLKWHEPSPGGGVMECRVSVEDAVKWQRAAWEERKRKAEAERGEALPWADGSDADAVQEFMDTHWAEVVA